MNREKTIVQFNIGHISKPDCMDVKSEWSMIEIMDEPQWCFFYLSCGLVVVLPVREHACYVKYC